jgi:hypothetical protein
MNRLFYPDQIVDAYTRATSSANNASSNYNLSETKNLTNTIPGGTVNVAEISITVRSGERITLAGQYSNISIHEDIFASCISGSITIIDTAGFLESFRIKGGEQINIKITKPKTNDIIIWREDLIVHKISESAVDPTTFNSSFDLHFVSRSHVNSLKKSLFKSYKNISYREAAKLIYSEMSVNDLIVDDPNLTLTKPFISTGLMPHKAMEFLCHRSCRKDKFFVFFERLIPLTGTYTDNKPFTASHYFGSIESLIAEANLSTPQTIYFNEKTNLALESGKIIRTPILERNSNFNHIQAMVLGFYNTSLTTIDPISRTHSTKKFGYTTKDTVTNDFYSYKLIDEYNIFNVYNDSKNEIPGRKLITSSINDTANRNTWLSENIVGHISKTLFKISVEIQGGTNNIGIGNIVYLYSPSHTERVSNPTNSNLIPNRLESGKYFVTTVEHRIRAGEYIKALTLSRASSPINHNKTVSGAEIDFSIDITKLGTSIGDVKNKIDLDNSSIVNNWRNNIVP